jgi:hypothetical protein
MKPSVCISDVHVVAISAISVPLFNALPHLLYYTHYMEYA